MPADQSFNKKEKLKSRKLLEQVFSSGRSFSVFPLKVFYIQPEVPLDFPLKTGVGASSKRFSKAVHRNRIKRLIREVYRTEKAPLHEFVVQHNKQVALFILYIDKSLPDYNILKQKMPLILQKLIKELNETDPSDT